MPESAECRTSGFQSGEVAEDRNGRRLERPKAETARDWSNEELEQPRAEAAKNRTAEI